MLWIGKEGMAAELIGIPQWETALSDTLYPEEPGGNEIRTQIPFEEEVPSLKKVVKKENRGKEKGQNRQIIW